MKNDTNFDKIEAWLSNELPETDALAFEAEIAADLSLATEVERHRRGRGALDRLAEQALQTNMALWRESMDEIPEPPVDALLTKRTKNWFRLILGGLLGILLVGTVYWLWSSKNGKPIHAPVQEIAPPQTKPDEPIAITPSDKPDDENKVPTKTKDENSLRLIAMAETNLSDLQGAILNQYGQTMGEGDEENPFFESGVKAFMQNDLKLAKRDLLKVPKTDPFFPSAQEMLALIYFKEKNYSNAVLCYENFARQNADPTTDWRLLQFYLTDYRHHKENFSKKLEEIIDPKNQHQFREEAEKLKREMDLK